MDWEPEEAASKREAQLHQQKVRERRQAMKIVGGIVVGLVAIVVIIMVAIPQYRVYSQTQSGKAALEQARHDRQIVVEEAQANLEGERLNAEAEVARARGAAEAIRIEGGRLTDQYIKYLWVRQQGDLSDSQVIYIPTEAGLPILEAGKR